ncbi:MAG: prepilin peptidase [Deltaproteobacteria bacterium]|nr:prepilin peptidase [Deltaproteobacteria bacterium]
MLRDLEPLATSWGAYAFAVFLGLLWGSFANVCVYRWPPSDEFPKGRSVVAPGSHCFACQAPIHWYDNVPLLSWLWLRGRCRSCKAPFSARYLIVEAVTGLLFGLAWFAAIEAGALAEPFDLRLARFGIYAAFCFVMVVISFIDLDHKLILDKITLPSIVIFYGLGLVLGRTWHHGLIGAAIGYGLPWSIGEIYWILTDREGLGLGDSKLLAVIGALLGATGVVASLFGGAVVGAIVGVFVLLRAPDRPVDGAAAPRSPPLVIVCSVVAVASVVVASIGGLLGWFWLALPSAAISVFALIGARRFEPHAAEAEPDVEEPAPEVETTRQVGGSELAIRVLAIGAGAGVLFAVTGVLLGTLLGAAIAGGVGLALLVVARRLKASQPEPAAAELDPVDSQPDPPSLMRTELPFGPFLAAAAVFYLFAEPWIVVNFRLPGG